MSFRCPFQPLQFIGDYCFENGRGNWTIMQLAGGGNPAKRREKHSEKFTIGSCFWDWIKTQLPGIFESKDEPDLLEDVRVRFESRSLETILVSAPKIHHSPLTQLIMSLHSVSFIFLFIYWDLDFLRETILTSHKIPVSHSAGFWCSASCQ